MSQGKMFFDNSFYSNWNKRLSFSNIFIIKKVYFKKRYFGLVCDFLQNVFHKIVSLNAEKINWLVKNKLIIIF